MNTLLYRAWIDPRSRKVKIEDGSTLGPGVVVIAIPSDMTFADFMSIHKEIAVRFQREGPNLTRRRL